MATTQEEINSNIGCIETQRNEKGGTNMAQISSNIGCIETLTIYRNR